MDSIDLPDVSEREELRLRKKEIQSQTIHFEKQIERANRSALGVAKRMDQKREEAWQLTKRRDSFLVEVAYRSQVHIVNLERELAAVCDLLQAPK